MFCNAKFEVERLKEVWRRQAGNDLKKAHKHLMEGKNPGFNKWYYTQHGRWPWEVDEKKNKMKSKKLIINL